MDVIIPRLYADNGELVIQREDILFLLININNYIHLVMFALRIIMKIRKGTSVSQIIRESLEHVQKCFSESEDTVDRSEEKNKNMCDLGKMIVDKDKNNGNAKKLLKEGIVLRKHTQFILDNAHAETPLIGITHDENEKTTATFADDTARAKEVDIQNPDNRKQSTCTKAKECQHNGIDKTTACSRYKTRFMGNSREAAAPERITSTDVKTQDNVNEMESEMFYANPIERIGIKCVDDSPKQSIKNKMTVTHIMQYGSDDCQTEERTEMSPAENSRMTHFSDGLSYDGCLRNIVIDASSLTFETENTDHKLTEETHLKTVYDSSLISDNDSESTPEVRDSTIETAKTVVEEPSGKSRIVTSADGSDLHELLRKFFESEMHFIKPQELLDRTFGVSILVMKIDVAPTYVSSDSEDSLSPKEVSPVHINREDEACISSYFSSRGFQFHCRDETCFYFGVGNRGRGDVNAEIDRMEAELHMLCFGRFFGRNIGGRRINSPEDLVISFRIEGFERSSWRFYYLLFENTKMPVLVRHTYQMQRWKLACMNYLLALLYFLVCFNKALFRKE